MITVITNQYFVWDVKSQKDVYENLPLTLTTFHITGSLNLCSSKDTLPELLKSTLLHNLASIIVSKLAKE